MEARTQRGVVSVCGSKLWALVFLMTLVAAPLAAGDAASRPWLPADAPAGKAVMRKAASYPLPPAPGIDLDDQRAVLAHVMAGLASEVAVLPTENYLYWRFNTEDKEIWGNVRLGPGSRDEGRMFIGYYEFREDLTGPEEAHPRYAELGPGDGLDIHKLDDFLYDVSYRGSTVRFALNRLSQEAPRSIGPDEAFVFRTHDESGVQFHLLFNRRTRNFLFVANEEERPLGHTQTVGERLVLDTGTGFLFYVDADHGDRKILLGVYRRNVAQNNYYDGPADQLADNYIAGVPKYKSYLHQAYPFTRGVIDDYGFYQLDPANRVAVAPYYAYTSLAEVSSMMRACGRFANVGDVLACMVPGGFHAEADGEAANPFAGVPGIPGLPGLPGAGQTTEEVAGTEEDVKTTGTPGGGNPRPIHAALITWHLNGQTFIPPGSIHASLITWHVSQASFVPPGSIHASLITWHIGGQSFVPPGSIHASLITWHLPNASFVPPGSIHASLITWHIGGQSFVPPGSIHASLITWHLPNASFVPPGSIHASLITWHIGGQSFVPPGSIHASLITWHVPNASFVPPGSKHASLITWHIGGQSFIPPGSIHASLITWHVPNASFIPPGSKHASLITWHIGGQSFIPPGSIHASLITWHMPNASFIPPGSRHASLITWHLGNQTFIPPGSIHASYITWHIGGQSFIPPGSIHAAYITWHVPSASFVPPGSIHASLITWHIGGQSFVPPGSIHASLITWHMPSASFVPPGSIHASLITWHIGGQSFVPPGSRHASLITWHLGNISFIPPNAKHMSLISWHYSGASFLLAPPSSGGTPGNDPPQWDPCANGNCTPIACHQESCNPEDGSCEWTPTPGVACDDGDPYTVDDLCDEYGSCLGSTPVGSLCDDGNPCTVGDVFDTNGACVGQVQAGLACSDGNQCTIPGSATCSAQGLCVGKPWVGASCNDGDQCNVNDVCDEAGFCHGQEALQCDDLQACNGQETCDPEVGCLPGIALTCGDACAGETGECDDPFGCVNESAPICEPEDACMTTECDPILGTCTQIPLDCDDGNPCTVDSCERVDDVTSVCEHLPATNGTVCDDGIACSTGTVCSAGACGGGSWLQTPECACPALKAPVVTVVAQGASKIVLSWSAVPGAVQYRIYRATSSGGPYTQVGATTGTSYTVTGLACNTKYFFMVRAVSACGDLGPMSPQVSAKTMGC